MIEQKIKTLDKESLKEIISEMAGFLSEEQYKKLELIIDNCIQKGPKAETAETVVRMSQDLIDEKMEEFFSCMEEIDEGELYLDAEEYEDYSSGYWDSEWYTEYYDNQGIGEILSSMIQFAKDCVDDRRYQEANQIYEWLWEMSVSVDSEYEDSSVDLDRMVEQALVHTDLEQLALLTLYTEYQVQEPKERADNLFQYFYRPAFRKLHMEEMFHVGRENLTETEQFWRDWISLLKTKSGETESRLLKEAVLYKEGIDGLVKMADETGDVHPTLYLAAMEAYEMNHDYVLVEEIGRRAMDRIDGSLTVRSEIALKAACSASYLNHMESVMLFCWECFRSDPTDRNFLRLFGTKEMAEQYGMRGKEVLCGGFKGTYGYEIMSFYTGNFEEVKQACKNPNRSLGWSSCFIGVGIHLFLLYLYENPLPSKAAESVANCVGFPDDRDADHVMDFESEIIQESRKHKTSLFWNYFQRWKPYFPMERKKREEYLGWAKTIAYNRADAIVSGQHRRQYRQVAVLLAMVAEIEESMGMPGAKRKIYADFKAKFPRHSSFQAEMKNYFGLY